jgi:hypothetical protein
MKYILLKDTRKIYRIWHVCEMRNCRVVMPPCCSIPRSTT